MTTPFAVIGDGQNWLYFTQPIEQLTSSGPIADLFDDLQAKSAQSPVTFALDYEGAIAHAYPGLAQGAGLHATVWEKVEYLSLDQLYRRLPTPAQNWSWQLEYGIEAWTARLAKLQDYLAAGDCYQGNLTLQGRGECHASAAALWHALMRRQPSPYAAFLPWQQGHALSLSPELLWRVNGQRIQCEPMKGTVALGQSESETQALAGWLQNDQKNRAENLMILDLIRNDLGRIAQPGSVKVPESFQVRRYQTLQQMVSTVQADLMTSRMADWAQALMPFGSITGAPKKRSIEILNELEPSPRGLYTGSCGYIYQGQSVANVAIRTATLHQGQLEFGVGGGITLDSTAEDEWQEVLLKTRFIQPPDVI